MSTSSSLPTEHAPHLLSPIDVAGLKLRNRVVLAPLTRGRSTVDRVPTASNLAYYTQRAETTGLVIVEGTTIDDNLSNGWAQNTGIYTAEQVEAWKPITAAVHAKGSKIICQLWHLGRAGHSTFLKPDNKLVAASALTIDGSRFGSDGVYAADGSKQPYEEPRALTTDDIAEVVATFGRAAANAKEAGFDGVEVHSANGYLLNTFLDSRSNKRTDQYGPAPLENRVRLLHEVIDACAEHFPINRIGVRLSPNGAYNDMGSADSIEVYTFVLKSLAKRGLLYTHVMDGLAFGFHKLTEPFTIEAIRAAYGPGTLIANCGYTRESGDKVVASGAADLVAYGRPFISNPDLAYRFAHDLPLAESNPATWFSHGDEGYCDYPTALEEVATKAAGSKEGEEAAAVSEKEEPKEATEDAAATAE